MLQIADSRHGQREFTDCLLLLGTIMPDLKEKVCHPVKDQRVLSYEDVLYFYS